MVVRSSDPLFRNKVHVELFKDPIPFGWLTTVALLTYLGAVLIGRSLRELRSFPASLGSLLAFGVLVHQIASPNASVLTLAIAMAASLGLHVLIRRQMVWFDRVLEPARRRG